jgi:hypothetical protein
VPHPGDPVTQRCGGPHRGGGGVVQLVGEPGRQRPERQQLLALPDDVLGGAHAQEQALQQVDRHREPGVHHPGEVLGAKHEEAGVADHPDGRGVGLPGRIGDVGLHGAGVDTDLVGAHRLDVVLADPAAHRDAAAEQDDEQLRRGTLRQEGGAARRLDDPAVLGQPLELLAGELLEQEQVAQRLRGQPLGSLGNGHGDPR